MLFPAAARDKAASLVGLARKKGADAADAVYVGERSQGVSVRLGALEDVHRSEGEEIGLRVFVGKRNATISSSDLSTDALTTLVDRGLAMAAEAPEDQYAGLAPDELLFRGEPQDLDLDDGGDPDPAELKARALAAEDAARSVEGVTNSNGSSASASASIFAIATSNGFASATRATGYSNSASVVAGGAGAMQRDYAWRLQPPGETLRIHMDVRDGAEKDFDATLVLERRAWSGAALARCLLRYPLMTLKVVLAIHWQAFLIWRARNPVYDHPRKTPLRGRETDA